MSNSEFIPTPQMAGAVNDWLRLPLEQRARRALIPYIKNRFNLTNLEAIEVLHAAAKKREARDAKAS